MQDIYIGDEGKGFPLVLVHGFLGSSAMWKPQIDFLKDLNWGRGISQRAIKYSISTKILFLIRDFSEK